MTLKDLFVVHEPRKDIPYLGKHVDKLIEVVSKLKRDLFEVNAADK